MNTGHNVQPALEAVTASGAGAALSFQLGPKEGACAIVTGITTATVAIQGRISPTAPWVTLGTPLTADGLYDIPHAMPEMRANVTAYTSGTITVWIKA